MGPGIPFLSSLLGNFGGVVVFLEGSVVDEGLIVAFVYRFSLESLVCGVNRNEFCCWLISGVSYSDILCGGVQILIVSSLFTPRLFDIFLFWVKSF